MMTTTVVVVVVRTEDPRSPTKVGEAQIPAAGLRHHRAKASMCRQVLPKHRR